MKKAAIPELKATDTLSFRKSDWFMKAYTKAKAHP